MLGDCENIANVYNGQISVGGSVKSAGLRNSGAIIRIGGSVTEEIAKWMRSGEIHVEGDMPRIIREFGGGRIFHRGELVVDLPREYCDRVNRTIELPGKA